jgi:hypothetical protein
MTEIVGFCNTSLVVSERARISIFWVAVSLRIGPRPRWSILDQIRFSRKDTIA